MHNIKKYKIFYSIFFPLIILLIGNLQAAGINDINRNSGVYYGIPSLVNGSGGDTDLAAEEFNNFRFIVYPDGLESSGHPDYNNAYIIATNLHTGTNNTKIFGYVPIGLAPNGEDLTLSQISNRIYQWYNNYTPYIDGIFLDEFGYDYNVTRERQNKAVDWVHNYGLKVIANGWNPDHCLALVDDPGFPNSTYNSNLEPTHISNGDYYCYENWVWYSSNGGNADWEDKDLWKDKAYKVFKYKESLGINIFTISVEEASFANFGTAGSRVHEDFAFWCVLAVGFSNFQFSEYNYSSGNENLYWYDRITDDIGTNYISELQEVTNGIFYRYTDTGIIRLDWNTYTGSFISLGADINPPTFATNNFIPRNNQNNVSFSVVVYIEIDDDRGVIKDTLNVQINNTNAITNGLFLPLFDGLESKIVNDDAGGYNIYIDRTNFYAINAAVNVIVWGADGAGNSSTNTYSFQTGHTDSCITCDGDLSDWPGFAVLDVDSSADLTNDQPANIIQNYIFDGIDEAKSTNIYIAFIQNASLNNGGNYAHQIYFDIDNNSATGNTVDVWWQVFGAEYFVEFYTMNDELDYCEGVKKWTNAGWQNTGVMPFFGVSGNIIEIGISLSKLGAAGYPDIGLTMTSYSTNWVDMDENNEEGENKIVYSFQRKVCPDIMPPFFATNNFSPVKGESNASFRAEIYIEIDDDGLVAANAINVQINGTNAIINGVFQSGFNGSNSSLIYDGTGGYDITIDRTNDFGPFAVIDVEAWAQDMYGNAATNTYSFTTGHTNQCIVADGDLSDWPGFAVINRDPRNDEPWYPPTDIVANYIFDGAGANMATNLYLAFKEQASLNDGNEYEHLIYIDADRNAGTGNTIDTYWVSPVMGADYMIDFYTQNDNVSFAEDIAYWNGSAWVSTGNKPYIGVSGNTIELVIPFQSIGNPIGGVDITFASLDTNYIEDSNNDNNQSAIEYTFYNGICIDEEPPTFATNNFFPADGEAGAPFSVSLYIEIDDNAGVNPNAITVLINGDPAVISGVFQFDYDGSESGFEDDGVGGINMTIDPTSDFSPNQFIAVSIFVADFQDNFSSYNYSFSTGETNVCITIDGNLDDWSGYYRIKTDPAGDNTADPGSDIQRVYYAVGSTASYVTNLYIAFKFDQSQADGNERTTTIYIDADNNTSTGNLTEPWFTLPAGGAEYYIEIYTLNDGISWRGFLTNSGTEFVEVPGAGGLIQASVSGDIIEMAIPYTLLSKITGSTINLAFTSSKTDWIALDYAPDQNNPAFQYGLQYVHCFDVVPPYVANSSPKNGFKNFSADWDIKVWLNDNNFIVSNSIVIKIDKGGGDINTAFSNGSFLTGFATGTITSWFNGYYLVIDPNNDLPKSALIFVDVYCTDLDINVCDTNFSFTTAYTTYNPPPPPPPGINKPFRQGGYFYGWMTFLEGGKDEYDNPEVDPPWLISECASVLDDYHLIVLPYDLVWDDIFIGSLPNTD